MKVNALKIINNTRKFKINPAYEAWLREFITNPNNDELNQMEKELTNFPSVNNLNYQPLKGA